MASLQRNSATCTLHWTSYTLGRSNTIIWKNKVLHCSVPDTLFPPPHIHTFSFPPLTNIAPHWAVEGAILPFVFVSLFTEVWVTRVFTFPAALKYWIVLLISIGSSHFCNWGHFKNSFSVWTRKMHIWMMRWFFLPFYTWVFSFILLFQPLSLPQPSQSAFHGHWVLTEVSVVPPQTLSLHKVYW